MSPLVAWSFEPYVEFVAYSTRVLGSKAWAVGRGTGPLPYRSPECRLLIVGHPPPGTRTSTHCWLEVCAAVLADSPSVTSFGLISGGHESVTFVTTVFGRDRRLIN